jgi:DNA adenine methylase
MLVVKSTELMRSLYEDAGLRLLTYDMKYSVSFMNRNDRDVKHLLVLNYDPPSRLLSAVES